ncbi:MAG: DUF4331 domain-containing protein [Deltaproteobacteria bacterium]|nr:DUF4331 domain-containing protein [Myxococcales bacterium]MDP3216526.1 DUF4331 domain-containing protein [Deltaproteobacteria bacterium]
MTTKTKLGAALLLTMAATGFMPQTADASSHREAPLISEDAVADNTDLWAFTSPENNGTVSIVAGYIGFEDPAGGPNWMHFSDDVLYEIKIDNNGDGVANDVVYQIRFSTTLLDTVPFGAGRVPGASGTFFANVGQYTALPTPENPGPSLRVQTYNVTRVVNGMPTVVGSNIPVAPTYVGRFAFGTGGQPAANDTLYTTIANQAVTNLNGGVSATGAGRAFAGPRDDPFFADLGKIFDDATFQQPGFGSQGGGTDTLSGYNFHMIALQLPLAQVVRDATITDPANAGNVIGVYATASRPRVTIRRDCNSTLRGRARPLPQRFVQRCLDDNQGQWVQVSRLGIPLVNEVLIPLAEKDFWNRAPATEDVANFAQYLLVPTLPTYAQALYGTAGVRAQAGYVAPTRTVTASVANDMFALIAGAPPLIRGVPTAGLAPADLLRLNVRTTPTQLPTTAGRPTFAAGTSALGAAGGDTNGFPNGRRLFDDVVDIELRYVLNSLATINAIPFGDGVDGNDVGFTNTFPYVPIPRPGSESPRTQRVEPARP